MLKAAVVITVSSAFAGILDGAGVFKSFENRLLFAKKRHQVLSVTAVSSTAAAAFGCSQVMAVMLTNQLVSSLYKRNNFDKYELALDIENTAILISALIPWNIAGFIPASTLGVGPEFIPFAFYLFITPLFGIVYHGAKKKVS